MEKVIYIIPGYTESCRRRPYQQLAEMARKKGYEVVFEDVDWDVRLSLQRFMVPKDAVIFGFSLGAVLAHLVAQEFPCRHLILASMTPLDTFTNGKDHEALVDLLGKDYVEDVAKILTPKTRARKTTTLYGAKEGGDGDIRVPNTDHELTERYLKEIGKLL